MTLDFSSLMGTTIRRSDAVPIPTNTIRKMRWTYAADLQAGAFARSEFQVVVSNWTVTGTNRTYSVAGPGSLRIEDDDAAMAYSGTWTEIARELFGRDDSSHDDAGRFGDVHVSSDAGAHALPGDAVLRAMGALVSIAVDGGAAASVNLLIRGRRRAVPVSGGGVRGGKPHGHGDACGADRERFLFRFFRAGGADDRSAGVCQLSRG